VELAFQNGLFKNAEVQSGQALWQTDSPQLSKRLRASFASEHFTRRIPIDVVLRVAVGSPISATINWRAPSGEQQSLEIHSLHKPEMARKHPTSKEDLQQQFSRLGNSPYELRSWTAEILGEPMVPLSVLGELRKIMLDQLDKARVAVANRQIDESGVSERMLPNLEPVSDGASVCLSVLVRTMDQLRQVLSLGQKAVYVDFHDIREYRQAVQESREAEATIHIATLRIQKPGELGLFKAMAKHNADGWLVRNLAALDYARQHGIPTIGDFSLNITNPLTAEWLMSRGLSRLTSSYDLNRDQLTELVAVLPKAWLEVVIHQHMPMFHMEHCVFCTVLSPGTNKSNCGRPCDRHDVKLKDRLGVEHVLHADIGCRNTLYNGHAQSGAEATPKLIRMGIKYFRIELLRDAPANETKRLLGLYRDLLAGKIDGPTVWKSLKAENRVGVTRGTLEQPRNPLAIL
jgi:putative protease